jgi:hypothetical protein
LLIATNATVCAAAMAHLLQLVPFFPLWAAPHIVIIIIIIIISHHHLMSV